MPIITCASSECSNSRNDQESTSKRFFIFLNPMLRRFRFLGQGALQTQMEQQDKKASGDGASADRDVPV
jgi:hypothetical protein